MPNCSRCALDSVELPELRFDARGFCQYCEDWLARERERRLEATSLPWVLDNIRKQGRGKQYDVLLGLSGGVDSSYCLHLLVENGIRPLCWTMDNGYNDPKADENVMRLVEGMGVPLIRKVLDLGAFKSAQAAFIMSGTKNLEVPTDHVLMALGYEVAREYGIKTVISGGNHSTEGIMPERYGHDAKDWAFFRDVCRRNGAAEAFRSLPTMTLPSYLWHRYVLGIRTLNLLDYHEYRRDAAIIVLSEKYGYKSYGEKHCENYFTAWFQSWWLPVKWNLDKRKPHWSSLVMSGQMTRKQAIDGLLSPPEYPVLGIEEKAAKVVRTEDDRYATSEKWWRFMRKLYALRKVAR